MTRNKECHSIRRGLYHRNVERHERDLHDDAPVVLRLRVDLRLVVGEDVGDDAVRLLCVGGTARLERDGQHCPGHVARISEGNGCSGNYLQIHRMTEQKRISSIMILVGGGSSLLPYRHHCMQIAKIGYGHRWME